MVIAWICLSSLTDVHPGIKDNAWKELVVSYSGLDVRLMGGEVAVAIKVRIFEPVCWGGFCAGKRECI